MPSGQHPDVSASLEELERKLSELERELAGGGSAAPPTPAFRLDSPVERVVEPEAAIAPPPAPVAPEAEAGSVAAPEPGSSNGVDELRAEVGELLRYRTELESATRALIQGYDHLVERLKALEAAPPEAHRNGYDTMTFSGLLVVDAGPFPEVSTLAAFEEGLASIPGAQDVHVRSFEGDRAVIDLRLTQEVPLVQGLRDRLPLVITPTEAGEALLVVDVSDRPRPVV